MRCKKCLLPKDFPGLIIDKENLCNKCRAYEKINYKGEEELKKKLINIKKRKGKYDCLVMLSGGRDSTYLLLKLVKDYNMKVIREVSKLKKAAKKALKPENCDLQKKLQILDELYKKLLDIEDDYCEFLTNRGANLSLADK